jgi:hypothetical protein
VSSTYAAYVGRRQEEDPAAGSRCQRTIVNYGAMLLGEVQGWRG